MEPTRYRIHFEKLTRMRFTSHLDLHRSLERTIRRAHLPLAYSQGFNPRPRINLASALPLGYTSEAEMMDIWLEESIEPERLLEALQAASPPGLAVKEVSEVDLKTPALQTQVVSSEYEVTPVPEEIKEELLKKIVEVLEAEHIIRERRNKTYDLRPLIEDLHVSEEGAEGQCLDMRLANREGATGRPDEVCLALDLDPTSCAIHRTRIILSTE
jgi:radical SAM-linked protein